MANATTKLANPAFGGKMGGVVLAMVNIALIKRYVSPAFPQMIRLFRQLYQDFSLESGVASFSQVSDPPVHQRPRVGSTVGPAAFVD